MRRRSGGGGDGGGESAAEEGVRRGTEARGGVGSEN